MKKKNVIAERHMARKGMGILRQRQLKKRTSVSYVCSWA